VTKTDSIVSFRSGGDPAAAADAVAAERREGAANKWHLGFWDNNVTDHFYLTNAYDLQSLGFDYLHRGLPREFGVEAGYHF